MRSPAASLPESTDSVVAVLDADRELARSLPPVQRDAAAQALVAARQVIRPGPWSVVEPAHPDGMFGLLVVDGIACGTTDLGRRRQAELVGCGDLLRPWLMDDPGITVRADHRWEVVSPLSVLVLDRRFALAAARWPEIPAALMDRLALRARRLNFQMAISSLPRASERLLLTLWQLADRWGTVTPHGVLLRLAVTHRTLADLVGIHRPTVTTALGELRECGVITSSQRSAWLLRPPAPSSFAELRAQVGLPSALPAELA